MIEFDGFFQQTASLPISHYHDSFRAAIQRQFYDRLHGKLEQWIDSYHKLPELIADETDFVNDVVSIGTQQQLEPEQRHQLINHLQLLHPWRKGPWCLFGNDIDAEWCSNLKWDRIEPHISSLKDRLVLDIGCGNAYYGFRMLAQHPRYILAIDPSQKFLMQFRTFTRFLPTLPLEYLPLRDVDLPEDMEIFDTVFSMGVLYHRRSPLAHLRQLKSLLRSRGELILETLVIDGGPDEVLEPTGRYAQMANIHAVPSCECLSTWLAEAGFNNILMVDKTRTTVNEQRKTEWMQYQSLQDFLDPNDNNMTMEGHPAPIRAVFICTKK